MSYNPMTPGWSLGKWLCICQRCGRKRVNDEVAKEPRTNLLVCKDTCWEAVHPQEFVRSRPDEQKVPFTAPEPTDTFVEVTYADVGPSGDIPSGTFNTTDTIGS